LVSGKNRARPLRAPASTTHVKRISTSHALCVERGGEKGGTQKKRGCGKGMAVTIVFRCEQVPAQTFLVRKKKRRRRKFKGIKKNRRSVERGRDRLLLHLCQKGKKEKVSTEGKKEGASHHQSQKKPTFSSPRKRGEKRKQERAKL